MNECKSRWREHEQEGNRRKVKGDVKRQHKGTMISS